MKIFIDVSEAAKRLNELIGLASGKQTPAADLTSVHDDLYDKEGLPK